MKKSKKIMLCVAQVLILGLFVILASGSTDEEMVSVSRGIMQGNDCISRGFSYIGMFEKSDCSAACAKGGYNYYCTGENTLWCGCK